MEPSLSCTGQLPCGRTLSKPLLQPSSVPRLAARRSVLRPQASSSHKAISSAEAAEGQVVAAAEASVTRREAISGSAISAAALAALAGPLGWAAEASAVSSSRRALREKQIPDDAYTTLDNGLKYCDLKVGSGKLVEVGDRVAVHYVVKWKGVTFMTSRQGLGVTGGTPYGFDVGASDRGMVFKGLDLGVQGMRVGGERQLIVPPELGYGSRGVQEIPPNATLELNIEVLSVKETPFGYQVKLVEG